MPELKRVVIVGGGVGGLTSALALKNAGVEVEVHERYDHLAGRATGFTLWSYAIKILLGLGLDDPERIGQPIEVTEIHNQKGKLIEEMPVGDVSRTLGAPSCDVRRRDMQKVLIELLGDGIVQMGSEVVGVEEADGQATVVLAGGGRSTGDLVIGCDGIHSVVRDYVAPHSKLDYSGYGGWGGVLDGFEHELMKPNRHVEIWGRGSKAGVADVGAGQTRWYVVDKAPPADKEPVDKAKILEHIDGWYELIHAAVEAAPPESIVRTDAWDLEPLDTWVKGRVVLLGDSAHATTPFASMGACMTIQDCDVLVGKLTSDAPLDEALAAYQQDRKAHDEEVVKHSLKMGKMQMMHSPLESWLRDEAFSHAPPDKMRSVAEAMATGE
ncbi:MAG: FAD-dependent urate hydroxylase [Actinomycetota bacterium]|nr:FAD-dependent urate hydroxylase [Actinomycetota bacterium]